MTQTFNGCSHTEPWASPNDWRTTTAKSSLKKTWYVQCFFHDPAFKEKYPKGFPYRTKVNKGTTLEARKAHAAFVLENMVKLLDVDGFNPITKIFMAPAPTPELPTYNKETSLYTALDLACKIVDCEKPTKVDLLSVVKHFKIAGDELGFGKLKVNDFLNLHAIQVLERVKTRKTKFAPLAPLSPKRHNRYIVNLTWLFNILKKNKMVDSNPFEGMSAKPVRVEKRTTMTMLERKKVDLFLKDKFPNFWLFTMCFYHSAGREVELLSLKVEDVDLEKLTYTTLIKKGGRAKWVERPIKKISVPFWEKAMINAQKGDYIFSEGLKPGKQCIRRDQITRRWKVHVKDKLGIEADFYAMKHSNLTEISARQGAKAAAKAAGHTNERMVNKHYDVELEQREMDIVRNMRNHFVPLQEHDYQQKFCNPPAFTFIKQPS